MNENEAGIWLAVGLIPHRIEWRYLAGGVRTLEVRALFWLLIVRLRHSGRHDWTFRVPLIERLRDMTWAAIMQLRKDGSPQA